MLSSRQSPREAVSLRPPPSGGSCAASVTALRRVRENLSRFAEAERVCAARRAKGEAALRALLHDLATPVPATTPELDSIARAQELNSQLSQLMR